MRRIILLFFFGFAVVTYSFPHFSITSVTSPNSILFVLLQDLGWIQLPVPIPVEQCNTLAKQWMATEPKVREAFCVDPKVEI